MDFSSFLIYFSSNAGAVIAGLIFLWTVQNMQPLAKEKKTIEKLPMIIVLSIVLTPLGALIVSLFHRSRRLVQSIQQENSN